MKWGVWVMVLAISGCTTVADIEQTPPSMNVISGKKPDAYARCVSDKLAGSREPAVVQAREDGYRVIIAQSLSSAPAAVFDIEERSGGSSIKVHEFLSNLPLRSTQVRDAATQCISG